MACTSLWVLQDEIAERPEPVYALDLNEWKLNRYTLVQQVRDASIVQCTASAHEMRLIAATGKKRENACENIPIEVHATARPVENQMLYVRY